MQNIESMDLLGTRYVREHVYFFCSLADILISMKQRISRIFCTKVFIDFIRYLFNYVGVVAAGFDKFAENKIFRAFNKLFNIA